MRERHVAIGELEANLGDCLEEVRSGITLVVTDKGCRVARVVPEPEAVKQTQAALQAAGVAWSGRRPKKRQPSARLRGGGSMSDIVRENRR